jgi:hypothetical protein
MTNDTNEQASRDQIKQEVLENLGLLENYNGLPPQIKNLVNRGLEDMIVLDSKGKAIVRTDQLKLTGTPFAYLASDSQGKMDRVGNWQDTVVENLLKIAGEENPVLRQMYLEPVNDATNTYSNSLRWTQDNMAQAVAKADEKSVKDYVYEREGKILSLKQPEEDLYSTATLLTNRED